jgi:hypothetical protein
MPEFEVTAASAEELESLHSFLLGESLNGVRAVLAPGTPAEGELGAAEILTIIFTSGGGVALAQAVNSWVKTRQRGFSLTWRRTGDGSELHVESTGPDAQKDLRAFLTPGQDHD